MKCVSLSRSLIIVVGRRNSFVPPVLSVPRIDGRRSDEIVSTERFLYDIRATNARGAAASSCFSLYDTLRACKNGRH
jgi:hypothetical protein